jgi:hypothetical protein
MLDHGLRLETFCAKKIFEYQKTENGSNSHVDFPLPNSAEITRSFFTSEAANKLREGSKATIGIDPLTDLVLISIMIT